MADRYRTASYNDLLSRTSVTLMERQFKVGDQVNFSKRCQNALFMTVEAVDTNMFDTLIKVDGKWWHPQSFIPHEQWIKNYRKNT